MLSVQRLCRLRHMLPLGCWTFLTLFSASAQTPVSFRREIAPLLQRRCANCHNEENPKGGYRVDTFGHTRTAGDSGSAPLAPGKPADSLLHRLLITSDKDERMPQKADALPADELALVERWITQGAASDADRDDQPLAELVRERHLRPAPAHYARPLPVTALSFDTQGRRIATSGYREVLVWDAASGALLRRVGGLPERITALAWHRDTLAVAGGTPGQWGTVALVDTASDWRVRILCDLPEMALALAFSPDGASLAAGSGDRTLRIFDTPGAAGSASAFLRTLTSPGGTQRKVLRHHADWVQAVAFSPNGKLLITASRDRTARIVGTAQWEIDSTYDDHTTPLLAAAFTAEGKRAITAARGGALHLWMPESAQKRADFTETGGDIRQLVSAPAFGTAAASADGTLRLYQEGARKPWLELPIGAPIESVATTRSGDQLATATTTGEVTIWAPHCWEPVARFRAMP